MTAQRLTRLLTSPLVGMLLFSATGCGASSEGGETNMLTEDVPEDDIVDESSSDETDIEEADSDDVAGPGAEETDTNETDSEEPDGNDSTDGEPPSPPTGSPVSGPVTPPPQTDPVDPSPPAAPPTDPVAPAPMPTTQPLPPGPIECPRIGQTFCEQSGCLAITSVDGIYRGCTYPTSCEDGITCGQAPGGTQVEFPNSCLPITWETCEAAAEVECEDSSDCTGCRYAVAANPNDAEPVCPCPTTCDMTPMSRSACEMINESWAPFRCDASCRPIICTGFPRPPICVEGRCVLNDR